MPKEKTIKGFNTIAPFYNVVSTIGSFNKIHKSQMWLLSKGMKSSKTLIMGGGDGKFLLEAMKQQLSEQYYYIDISDAMIKLAQIKIEKQANISLNSVVFICGSYQDIPANEKFDLIITPYFLDCFSENELPLVMTKLHTHLTMKGTWFFTDFNIPEESFRNFIFRNIIQLLYGIFNLFCDLGVNDLPDFNKEFPKYGFTLLHEKYFLNGLLVSRIYKNKISKMESSLKVLTTNRNILLSLLEKYSLQQLNLIPADFNNNIIWNIGHIIIVQQRLIYALSNLPLYISDDLVNLYKPGTKPLIAVTQEEVETLKSLLTSLVDNTKNDLAAGKFQTFTEITISTGFNLASIEDAMTFNNFHEGLHLGYIQSIRKFL